jgi:type III secretory pathway component EscR
MNKQRLRQISVSFLIVLSFFVSSTAACACSHHIENVEVEVSSCHEHSETKQNNNTNFDENVQQFCSDDDCCCFQSAPRVFSKSETVKIEKQTAVLPLARVEIKAVATVVSVENTYFEKPFYLSDSFYNIKSPRAPPRL